MGTNSDTYELQEQIRSLISKLGWTQNRLAREIYVELNEWEDPEDVRRFQEKLKKELQRPTTKPDRLKEYLRIICNHNEAKSLSFSFVLNQYVQSIEFSESFKTAMEDISLEIDEKLRG